MSTTLLSSFKPILLVSKIFGLLSTPLNDHLVILQTIYIVGVAIVYCVVNSYYALYVMSPVLGSRAVLQATDWIRTFCGFSVSLCFYYKALNGRQELLTIFKSFDHVDDCFKNIGIKFDYKHVRKALIFQMALIFGIITGLGTVMLNTLSEFVSERWLTFLLSSFPLYLIYCNCILFANIVFVIYLKYKEINKFSLEIQNGGSNLSLIYKATKCFDELNDVVTMVNDLFGLSNLMTISKFIHILVRSAGVTIVIFVSSQYLYVCNMSALLSLFVIWTNGYLRVFNMEILWVYQNFSLFYLHYKFGNRVINIWFWQQCFVHLSR